MKNGYYKILTLDPHFCSLFSDANVKYSFGIEFLKAITFLAFHCRFFHFFMLLFYLQFFFVLILVTRIQTEFLFVIMRIFLKLFPHFDSIIRQ